MGRLANKVAIITGAASGMGLAAVELFTREGARVVATDIAFEQLKEATAAIGGEILCAALDVASEEQWKQVVSEAVTAFGKVDILVNNAGVSFHKKLLDETLEGWNRSLSLNLTSVFLGMQSVIPTMQQNGGGSIVNCVSLAAIIGSADNGAAAYAAAKGGVRALSKHAAVNFAQDNIRVNSIYPGAILTGAAQRYGVTSREVLGKAFEGVIPLPPFAGEAIDIANGYLYLASDESKFVTGEELIIDGGWSAK
ncbi:NAD(P)-dependent dehydrogenase (short-subunit alcohol dehydrogenase family) [Paenibacillus cellulosilyticus]|uniref:NAD(P)-dependent dehydrogenase (Short-subunit alcohol dehydrogenase family) n=1 Tax=Paenibacillus cellulosilyticus TaxID=375489 RepID=A0A2V2Z386_9BACL|nr:SDR family oxidoreductase [Paenibacillus cellulosilyticus]PWW08726.1 NAD(P)-dependent dehydrogenase (short-subunit alcohol dehydrogenase family) [Paenibacillus cellulosilyticus]QKS48290.1 SDR family oxidoreductase [Paenibacillus cellulosilyticus]